MWVLKWLLIALICCISTLTVGVKLSLVGPALILVSSVVDTLVGGDLEVIQHAEFLQVLHGT